MYSAFHRSTADDIPAPAVPQDEWCVCESAYVKLRLHGENAESLAKQIADLLNRAHQDGVEATQSTIKDALGIV
jgi:hypothetical protein